MYLDELQKHNCQLWYQGWVSAPGIDDDKQIYHTSSAVDGSNYMSFGSAESDRLLDEIRTELDDEERNKHFLKWQVNTNTKHGHTSIYMFKIIGMQSIKDLKM